MINGIGIDIVKIDRVKKILESYRDRFLQRILSPGEIGIISEKNPVSFVAGRFAVKEAIFKAIGKKDGISFSDIEILNDVSGKPYINDINKLKNTISSLKGANIIRIHISISHEKEFAAASAVIEIL